MAEMPKRLFTVKEAACYLGIPIKTIHKALAPKATEEEQGRFPVPARKRGKTWLFERHDLDLFADSLPWGRK